MEITREFTRWSGTASFNGSVYKVTVVAADTVRWESEITRAISTAGGRCIEISEGKPFTANDRAIYGAAYMVTFIPEPRFTEDAAKKSPESVLLRSVTSRIPDGELMRPSRSFMKPSKNIVAFCTQCGAPGIRGNPCKSCNLIIC